ncbi:hypothetical protein MHYP_G00033070 [Metynnis hypsauchen]
MMLNDRHGFPSGHKERWKQTNDNENKNNRPACADTNTSAGGDVLNKRRVSCLVLHVLSFESRGTAHSLVWNKTLQFTLQNVGDWAESLV